MDSTRSMVCSLHLVLVVFLGWFCLSGAAATISRGEEGARSASVSPHKGFSV